MLLGALGAILLRNMLPGKGAIGTRDGVIWAGEGATSMNPTRQEEIRVGQDF